MTQHQRVILKDYFPVLCIVVTCAMAFGATKMKLEDLDQRFSEKMQEIEQTHNKQDDRNDKQDNRMSDIEKKQSEQSSMLNIIDFRLAYVEKHK